MSGIVTGWAKARKPSKKEAKPALVFLADYAFDGYFAFPSVATIAEELMVDERSVQRHYRTLEADGLIIACDVEDRATGRTRTRAYYFPVENRPPNKAEIAAFERKVGGRVTRVSPWEGDMGVTLEGDTGVTGEGDTGVTGRVTTVSPLNDLLSYQEGSEEPSLSARERLTAVLGEIERAVDKRVLGSSDPCEALAVLSELEAAGVDLAELPECARRWCASPRFRQLRVPRLEVWLGKGHWRADRADVEAEAAADAAHAMRDAIPPDVAAVLGPGVTNGATWHEATRVLVAHSNTLAKRVRETRRADLQALDIRVMGPGEVQPQEVS